MKKKIVAIVMAFILSATALTFVGCGSSDGWDYSHITTNREYADVSEMNELANLLDFVYEDTTLKIKDDGTWKIDTPLFLFFRSNVDKGTYTVKNGIYVFEGFEYDLKTIGEKTSNGFNIYFLSPADDTSRFITLTFE